eukprot:gene15319-4587_t
MGWIIFLILALFVCTGTSQEDFVTCEGRLKFSEAVKGVKMDWSQYVSVELTNKAGTIIESSKPAPN